MLANRAEYKSKLSHLDMIHDLESAVQEIYTLLHLAVGSLHEWKRSALNLDPSPNEASAQVPKKAISSCLPTATSPKSCNKLSKAFRLQGLVLRMGQSQI